MNQYQAIFPDQRLQIVAAGLTATGQFTLHNDDAFALHDSSRSEGAAHYGQLYLLADGRGSNGAGGVASRMAIETISTVYYEQSDALSPLSRLQQAFLAAHARVSDYANTHSKDQVMTTCIAAAIKGNKCWIGHIGDSRAYLVRSHSEQPIRRLTTDHSWLAKQMRAIPGHLRSISNPPETHDILLRALGIPESQMFYPDFVIVTLRAGDALLLCSDGLWQALTEEQMARIVSEHTPEQACHLLIRQANARSESENISAVVLSFQETV
jgi:serine/threonine protein phosphatase PrpC